MVELTLENFEDEVLNSSMPVLVAFKHDNCHLCRGLNTVLWRLSYKYNERVKFAIIDSIDQDHLTDLFEVGGVPTVFLFTNGDGREIEYPERPSSLSGYSDNYLINFLDDVLGDE
jgi:thioredoxin 1